MGLVFCYLVPSFRHARTHFTHHLPLTYLGRATPVTPAGRVSDGRRLGVGEGTSDDRRLERITSAAHDSLLIPTSQVLSCPYPPYPHPPFTPFPFRIVRFHTFTSQYAPQAGVTGGNATRRERRPLLRSGNNMRLLSYRQILDYHPTIDSLVQGLYY